MIECKGLVFAKNDLWMTTGNASTNPAHVDSLRSALRTNPTRGEKQKPEINKKRVTECLAGCLYRLIE